MPKRYMESREGASCMGRWRLGSLRQLGEHLQRRAGTCPRPGSVPVSVSTRAWERKSQGEGWSQVATEMFSFCHGK